MAMFKERLEYALKIRDIAPAELSRRTGIGEGAISQYRKGAYKASQRNLEKIARALGVSIEWLMGYDETEKPAAVSDELLREMERRPLLRELFEILSQLDEESLEAFAVIAKLKRDQ